MGICFKQLPGCLQTFYQLHILHAVQKAGLFPESMLGIGLHLWLFLMWISAAKEVLAYISVRIKITTKCWNANK